jgi:hypothetical protein
MHKHASASFMERRRVQLTLTSSPPADLPRYQPRMAAHLTLSSLLARGWKRTTVEALLGAPDQLRPNPHHPEAPPMRLYRTVRVNAAERSPQFAALQAGKHKST